MLQFTRFCATTRSKFFLYLPLLYTPSRGFQVDFQDFSFSLKLNLSFDPNLCPPPHSYSAAPTRLPTCSVRPMVPSSFSAHATRAVIRTNRAGHPQRGHTGRTSRPTLSRFARIVTSSVKYLSFYIGEQPVVGSGGNSFCVRQALWGRRATRKPSLNESGFRGIQQRNSGYVAPAPPASLGVRWAIRQCLTYNLTKIAFAVFQRPAVVQSHIGAHSAPKNRRE